MTDRRPPFYWCHDDQIPDDVTENPLNKALEPLTLSDDEARELDDLLEHSTALPTLPIRGVPHRERAEANDAADEAPQDGETYVSSWGEMLYEMTNGEMGTPPPQTLRRYEPKPPPPRQARKKR